MLGTVRVIAKTGSPAARRRRTGLKISGMSCDYNATVRFLVLLFPLLLTAAEKPFLESEFIFPLETWHNHASCIVELSNDDLLVCWFHGSGERTADDVKIEGARLRKGSHQWSKRFTLADTPG